MHDKDVRINKPAFLTLTEHFNRIVEDKAGNQPLPSGASNAELRQVQASLKDAADAPLVSFKGGEFTVREFVVKLLNMPSGLRPKVNMCFPEKGRM